MAIEQAELNEWIATDEGKGWLDKQTQGLRQKLGNTESKLTELETSNQALEASNQELSNETQKLNRDLEAAQTGQVDPNEELEAKIKVLSTNLQNSQIQTANMQKQILNEKLTGLINDEINKQGGNPKVLSIHVRRQLEADLDEDGHLSVYAVDENGKRAYDSEAKPAGVGYVVSQLKQDESFKASFTAPVKSGTGTIDPEDPKPSKDNQKSFLDMNIEELGDTANLKNSLFTQ